MEYQAGIKKQKGFTAHQVSAYVEFKLNSIKKKTWFSDKSYPKNSGAGFTLIELLVVIAIIGLLASVVLVSLNSARVKARDTKRKADIAQIQKALELYYDDSSQYPPSGGATSPNGGWSNSSDASWTTLAGALRKFMSSLPKDPLENSNAGEWGASGYHYSYFSGGYGCNQQWYMLVYRIETASGPDPSVTACDGTTFQYGGNGANTNVKTVGSKAR